MTSLSEAYGNHGRSETSLRRLYLGVGLFVSGVALLVSGLLVAGTEILVSMEGYHLGDARLYGGVLGGVGFPMVILGTLTVLPAGRTTRAAAVVGASICLLGVAMFYHAYPCQWIGNTCTAELTDLTLPTAGLYFLGAATSFWCLFVGIANFKTRNDPGGTVTMEVTHKGETKVIEVDRRQIDGLGGVGFLGGTPDGEVETQTNDPTSGSGRSTSASNGTSSPLAGTGSVSDGGANAEPITSPMDADATPAASPGAQNTDTPVAGTQSQPSTGDTGGADAADAARSSINPTDRYCGNCADFDYVQTDAGMKPYCSRYDEPMDDMDACEEWNPRT